MNREIVGRPMEILLVEDDLLQARLAIEALKRGGIQHRMTLVRDGQEAMGFLRRQGIFARAPVPDLVLLDLRLPRIDGLDVLESIKGDASLNRIPVVIMTSSQEEEDRLRCQMLNVEAFMTKPVRLPEFLSLVRELRRFWQEDVILPNV
ncbi:MAG: response regulator [Thermoguttaceae bacterium]